MSTEPIEAADLFVIRKAIFILKPEQSDQMHSKQALSEWLIRRASTPTAATPEIAEEHESLSSGLAAAPPIFIDEFLWQPQFTTKPKRNDPDFKPAEDPASRHPDLKIPAGFHDAATLERLIEQPAVFSGLVVSIGVSHMDPASKGGPEALAGIQNFLLSLMRLEDFGCREKDNRFLLICPGCTGRDASKHLSSLSESLWDFQLRSLHPALNNLPFLLIVGAIDVKREPVGDAIASARERMTQTQRSRSAIAALTLNRLRKAV